VKIKLSTFQEDAVAELNRKIDKAHNFWSEEDPQVISFSAPTGSGKTIMMTNLFEEILYGNADRIADPNAIFVWLSDSPMLNEQTRFKIESQSDKIKIRDLVTIDSDFSAEILECGHIYFLNTQKLGSDKLLTTLSDSRQYSIWEALTNTAKKYPQHLYVVIDEAHRGTAASQREINKANSIMQKFIFGSEADGMIAMPLIIGMSATPQRFESLLTGAPNTVQKVAVSVAEVRNSGLLKDRIIIRFPEMPLMADMTILKSAVENWQDKCHRWEAYCIREGEKPVNPILVIQVEDAGGSQATATDIGVCMDFIEEAIGRKLLPGEVVHTFNDHGTLTFGETEIRQIEASRIEEDQNIRVVFFKMNLSTGWDCPRAETMMSFRSAQDYTYIAQLLGRMIRTPLARRIDSDAELNNVSLFLPYFDEDTVGNVIKALKDDEMATPADVGTARNLVTLKKNPEYDDVFAAMNNLVTYHIESGRKQQPLRLLMQLSRAMTMDGIDLKAQKQARNDIISQMTAEVEALKANGTFNRLAKYLTGFSMGGITFDYGDSAYTYNEETKELSVTEFDISRHFDQAGKILGEGLHTEYWIKHSDRDRTDIHVEVIVLANNTDIMERLNAYAERIFSDLYENNKRAIAALPEARKQFYQKLISSSPSPIAMPWQLPATIDFTVGDNSTCFSQHLYINDAGSMEANLNPWEKGVVQEELANGAVCWLRNLDRKPWSLCVPYEINGVSKSMFPDLMVVRADAHGYIFDILEPHDGSRKDNCPKAVGLAKFAEAHWDKYGRIELIREMRGPDGQMHFYRLDMAKTAIRNKVRGITNNPELDRIFDEDAVRED
jgi:type III restriction enzyme